jgi:hypothetical protein
MRRSIAVVLCLAAALCACGGTRDVVALTAETPETEQLRQQAFAAWADVGVETPADYLIGLLPHDELQAACETGSSPDVGGCTFQDERVIFIDADASAGAQRGLIVHELGHLTRGHHGHLPCDRVGRGPDTMCAHPVGATLTARDVAFVSG